MSETQTIPVPKHIDINEIRSDILTGLQRRLSEAAWLAKQCCENIPKLDHTAVNEVMFARAQLDRCVWYAEAIAEIKAGALELTASE
jgi:hypothetical protein